MTLAATTRVGGAAAVVLASAALGMSAEAPLRQRPDFTAATRLVRLEVTVKNARGEIVTDLQRDAFRVYEDGRPQTIAFFTRDDVPVSLGLLIDNSGSMRSLRTRVESAALTLARASNPLDELFVLNFADTPRIDVPFTSDIGVLERGIARVDSIGGTALRDAVLLGEWYVSQGSCDRRALVIVTDGRDNGSAASMGQITHRAEAAGIVIHAIGLMHEGRTAAKTIDDLDHLAERTGGVAYHPPSLEAIDAVASDLARQIRQRYTIAYSPSNQALDGSRRRIAIRIAGTQRLEVLTRTSYIASPP